MANGTIRALVCGLGVLASSAAAQRHRVDFEKTVLPLLEQHCFECHRAKYTDARGRVRKPKGDLRLDGKGWILRGGSGGEVVIAGDAEESELHLRVTLDRADDDFMPKDADPLTSDEIAAIGRWIDQGLEFGGWSGADGPVAVDRSDTEIVVPAAVGVVVELGKGVGKPARGAIAKLESRGAQVRPAQPGSPLLRVEFVSNEQRTDDAVVRGLALLGSHITELNLARTAIGDRALDAIARMPRLTRLDLRETAVTDRGVTALARLRELRYLNLYGTEITDSAVAQLAKLKKLESLYVWRTGMTDRGVAELRRQLPAAKIRHRLVLPPTAPAADAGGERRRRPAGGKKQKK